MPVQIACIAVLFIGLNVLVRSVQAKETALADAREQLTRARDEARYGALSGQVLGRRP